MGALASLRPAGGPGAADAAQNVQALLSSTREIELRLVRHPPRLSRAQGPRADQACRQAERRGRPAGCLL